MKLDSTDCTRLFNVSSVIMHNQEPFCLEAFLTRLMVAQEKEYFNVSIVTTPNLKGLGF